MTQVVVERDTGARMLMHEGDEALSLLPGDFRNDVASHASMVVAMTAAFGLVYAACNALLMSLVARLKRLIPPRFAAGVDGFLGETDEVLGQYLRGQLLVMAILAVFYTVGLAVVGLDLALAFGTPEIRSRPRISSLRVRSEG